MKGIWGRELAAKAKLGEVSRPLPVPKNGGDRRDDYFRSNNPLVIVPSVTGLSVCHWVVCPALSHWVVCPLVVCHWVVMKDAKAEDKRRGSEAEPGAGGVV